MRSDARKRLTDPAVDEWDEILHKHRLAWADYIENWDASVGPEPPTVASIVERLRSRTLPFGVSAGEVQ